MASQQNGAATGIAKDDAELRRRNVHTYEKANGGQVVRLEAEDKKKIKKQVGWLSFQFCAAAINQQLQVSVLEQYEYIIVPVIFTIIALVTRLYKIGLSPIVTWDEAQ